MALSAADVNRVRQHGTDGNPLSPSQSLRSPALVP